MHNPLHVVSKRPHLRSQPPSKKNPSHLPFLSITTIPASLLVDPVVGGGGDLGPTLGATVGSLKLGSAQPEAKLWWKWRYGEQE
jgi:hypothetical protein